MGWFSTPKSTEEQEIEQEQIREDIRVSAAKSLIQDIVEQQKRWGKHAGMGSHHPDAVLDALVVVHESGYLAQAKDTAEIRDALTLSNRQLGASKARETKLKKKIEELEAHIAALEEYNE